MDSFLKKSEERLQSVDDESIISYLMNENALLRYNLGRKYAHNKKLKKTIQTLCKASEDTEDECDMLQSQSGMQNEDKTEPGLSVDQPVSSTTQQITAFSDEDAGWKTEIHGEYDETRDMVETTNTELGSFLERPVRAYVGSWVVGQPFFYKFNPWATFQANDAVKDKIGNYELLRYHLNMKVVISGTPFHYGRSIVSYNPLSGLDEVTVDRNFLDVDVVGASQRPHFWLNPCNNEGGEMCMPFFWYNNYLSLSKGDANDMGEVVIKSLGNLLHANGGDDPVTITVYLWASDVVLTMPTGATTPAALTLLESQSGKQTKKTNKPGNNAKRTQGKGNASTLNKGDEYGSGIISKPAAAVAKAAGMLEVIPGIAPYARATSMIADKVGKVAQIFGYSRPTVITDIAPYKPNPTGNLANTDAADAAHKLTFDSKQELTIDSRTVGLDGTDQMGITDIVCRESYLTSFEWNASDAVDDILWNSYVTPNLYNAEQLEIHATPMAMIANIFRNWQGSVKFRFQIVKSQYHKGRILARYDPNFLQEGVEYNQNYSRVIDISEEEDFEIVIGWAQAQAFLNCGDAMTQNFLNFNTTRLGIAQNDYYNGVLELNVLNQLVSPSTDTPVRVNVFVSMCDDAKFAFPDPDKIRRLHYFAPRTVAPGTTGYDRAPGVLLSQSGTESDNNMPMGAQELQTIAQEQDPADHTMEVFYGDVVVSLRDLFKRYMKYLTRVPTPPNFPDVYRLHQYRDKVFPYHSGWDETGIHRSEDNRLEFLTVAQTLPLNFMAPCYAGWRGGIRRKFVYHDSNYPKVLQPTVSNFRFGEPQVNTRDILFSDDLVSLEKNLSANWNQFSVTGSTTTNIGVNNTLEVEFPFYQTGRFRSTRIIEAANLPGNSYQHTVTSYCKDVPGQTEEYKTTAFEEYVATGEDFSLFFFTGAPILYNYVVNQNS